MVGFFFGFVSKPGNKLSSSESVSSSGSDCGGGLALIMAKISISLLSLSAAAACHKKHQKSMVNKLKTYREVVMVLTSLRYLLNVFNCHGSDKRIQI